jgi:hypothetical protein
MTYSLFRPTLRPALVLGALLVGLGTAAAATPPSLPDADVTFLPDWQQNARPLFYERDRADGSVWRVPETLDRGTYRVIERDPQGVPHLIPKQRFKVRGGSAEIDLLLIPGPVRTPELLDERYLAFTPPARR